MSIHSKWIVNSRANDEINSELRSAKKSAERRHQIQVRTKATSTPASSTKGALEYSTVRDYSNHFIDVDLIPCSKLT